MSLRLAGQLARRAHYLLLVCCSAIGGVVVAWVLYSYSRPAGYLCLTVMFGGSLLQILLGSADLQALGWRARRRLYACRVRVRGNPR